MTESAAGQSESLDSIFRQAIDGNDPLPCQARLTVGDLPLLLDVPTGLGKTAFREQALAESKESPARSTDSRELIQLRSGGVS